MDTGRKSLDLAVKQTLIGETQQLQQSRLSWAVIQYSVKKEKKIRKKLVSVALKRLDLPKKTKFNIFTFLGLLLLLAFGLLFKYRRVQCLLQKNCRQKPALECGCHKMTPHFCECIFVLFYLGTFCLFVLIFLEKEMERKSMKLGG